jgi:hypothetical protein
MWRIWTAGQMILPGPTGGGDISEKLLTLAIQEVGHNDVIGTAWTWRVPPNRIGEDPLASKGTWSVETEPTDCKKRLELVFREVRWGDSRDVKVGSGGFTIYWEEIQRPQVPTKPATRAGGPG